MTSFKYQVSTYLLQTIFETLMYLLNWNTYTELASWNTYGHFWQKWWYIKILQMLELGWFINEDAILNEFFGSRRPWAVKKKIRAVLLRLNSLSIWMYTTADFAAEKIKIVISWSSECLQHLRLVFQFLI